MVFSLGSLGRGVAAGPAAGPAATPFSGASGSLPRRSGATSSARVIAPRALLSSAKTRPSSHPVRLSRRRVGDASSLEGRRLADASAFGLTGAANGTARGAAARATPEGAETGEASGSSTLAAAKIVLYVFLWYGFNIYFNIANKQLLNSFPYPWLISLLQLVVSGGFMAVLWVTGLYPAPRVSRALLVALAPVALFNSIGHVSACLSFSKMAVSFAHVVKSAEPVVSVALSQLLIGEVNRWYVWLSLLPIIAGCSLSAMKEVSFAWSGFNNAMVSNVGMVLRNVYSKKYLGDFAATLDGVNLFGILSILSFFWVLPAAFLSEGVAVAPGAAGSLAQGLGSALTSLSPSASAAAVRAFFSQVSWLWADAVRAQAARVGAAAFLKSLLVSGLFYHLYNQMSYAVLGTGISPVTFSVGNTMKRVAVVISSVLFFKNPVSWMNWIGSLVAMLGTGLYSAAQQKQKADVAQEKAAAILAATEPVAKTGL